MDDELKVSHFHHHEHFYNEEVRSKSRMLPLKPGPSYKVHANPDWVEATFIFPNDSEDPQAYRLRLVNGTVNDDGLRKVLKRRKKVSPQMNALLDDHLNSLPKE